MNLNQTDQSLIQKSDFKESAPQSKSSDMTDQVNVDGVSVSTNMALKKPIDRNQVANEPKKQQGSKGQSGKKDQNSRFETRQYTQEMLTKDQQKEYFDGIINKFLIQTDQYKPLRGTVVKPEKLNQMVEDREKEMLDQVLNKEEIKQKVLVEDATYQWIYKGKEEESRDWTIEFKSSGKVRLKDKEEGYWYKFDEHEFLFQVENEHYWMKYEYEKEIWTCINPWSSNTKGHEMKLKKPNAQGNAQQKWKSQNHKPIETMLQTKELKVNESHRQMMKCKIDYLPYSYFDSKSPNHEDEIKPNFIVKRIFIEYKLILQIWKNEINVKEPEKSKAEMLVQSVVNEVSGIETDPSYIWFMSANNEVYWFTIEQDWIEDKTDVYLNTFILDGENNKPVKKLLKSLEHDIRQGMLHSVHLGRPYEEQIFQVQTDEDLEIRKRKKWFELVEQRNNQISHNKYVIFVFANSWIRISNIELSQLVSVDDSIEIQNFVPTKDFRKDLKFDFSQPPILQYEQKSEKQKWFYINLGNQSEIICQIFYAEGKSDQKEEAFQGLYKNLKTRGSKDKPSKTKGAKKNQPATTDTQLERNIETEYEKALKLYDDRAKYLKNQSTTYQEHVVCNQNSERLEGLENSSCLRTRLDKYKAVKQILDNLRERLLSGSLQIQDRDLNKGVSLFFCYVGRPYMQVIYPVPNHDQEHEQIVHKLIHFDISPLIQNKVLVREYKKSDRHGVQSQTIINSKGPVQLLHKEDFKHFQEKSKEQNLILNGLKDDDFDDEILKSKTLNIGNIYLFPKDGEKDHLRKAQADSSSLYDPTQASNTELLANPGGDPRNNLLWFQLKEDLVVLNHGNSDDMDTCLKIYLPKTIDVRDFGDEIQPIVFQTDDSVRFVVVDTIKMTILSQLKIQRVIDRIEKNEDNLVKIEFCQSSEKKLSKNEMDLEDTEVKYQIIQYDRHVQMAMIDEISLKTSELIDFSLNKSSMTNKEAKICRTGMKFILIKQINEESLIRARERRLMCIQPLFTQDSQIHGTMMSTFNSVGVQHDIRLPNDEFMFDSQNLTRSGIREFRAAESILIAEVQLSELVQNTYDYFSEHEIMKILFNQLVNVLNTVTFDFEGILERDKSQSSYSFHSTHGYNHFKPLQIFGGKALVHSKLKKPDSLRKCLNSNLNAEHNYITYNQSALEKYLEGDRKLKDDFMKQGVLSDPKNPNISLDIQQISILDQAMEIDQFNSVGIIIDYMYEQEMGQVRYDMMMRTLLLAIDKKCCQYYIPFFTKQVDTIENIKIFNKLNMEIDVQDDQFERFCEKDLIVDQIINDETTLDSNRKIFEKMTKMDVDFCQNKQLFEVDHMFIDLRPCILYQKQQILAKVSLKDRYQIREGDFTNFDIAKMMREIASQTGENIVDTQVLRNVIDYQFDLITFRYFLGMWAVFCTTYILPFLIQIFTEKYEAVLVCSIICILSQLFFFWVELIQLKDGGEKFIEDGWNRVEVMMFVMNIAYFIIRLQHLDKSFQPLNENVASTLSVLVPMVLLNLILMMFCILKMMFYLRVFPSFGSMVQLMQRVLSDIATFTVFLIMWIAFFCLAYLITGLEISKEDYGEEMDIFFRTFIQTYRNSIGDLAPPSYKTWDDLEINDHWKNFIKLVIWLVWFLNQWIVLIILLNFLIAIVSQSFELVMTQEVLNRYHHRCQLNRECFLVLSQLNFLSNYNTLIVYSKFESIEDGSSEWLGFVTTIKNFIVKQNGSLAQKFNKMINNQMKNMNFRIDDMQVEQRTLQVKIQDVQDITVKVQEDLEKMTKTVSQQISKEVSVLTTSIDDIKKMIKDLKTEKDSDYKDEKQAKREAQRKAVMALGQLETPQTRKTHIKNKVSVAADSAPPPKISFED